jgi:hypothetical protein
MFERELRQRSDGPCDAKTERLLKLSQEIRAAIEIEDRRIRGVS